MTEEGQRSYNILDSFYTLKQYIEVISHKDLLYIVYFWPLNTISQNFDFFNLFLFSINIYAYY